MGSRRGENMLKGFLWGKAFCSRGVGIRALLLSFFLKKNGETMLIRERGRRVLVFGAPFFGEGVGV